MPKKFSGVNSKAEAAKAVKAEKAEMEKMKKKKAEEDAAWQDNDKSLAKKQVCVAVVKQMSWKILQDVAGFFC